MQKHLKNVYTFHFIPFHFYSFLFCLKADNISLLSCAAINSFKEQVEALQALDPSVEILVRLLCAVPGWSEKNVQVFLFFLN